jgi:hypothetical protein
MPKVIPAVAANGAPKFARAEQIQGNESACSSLCLNLDEQGEGQDRDDEGKAATARPPSASAPRI